jgi:hypothetical protein
MADSDKTVAYGVTADATPFEQGMNKAAESARNFAGTVDTNFKKVQDAFGQVQKQLLLLAGMVAGGAFFKDAIDKSNQLTGETMKLSKALGINAEEAGTLNTALKDIGSSGDDYVDTFTKFARQIKSNEAGLQAMGVQTRDANGNLRDSNTLFTEGLRSVGGYKAGLDQNTYAQTIFGKSVSDVMTLQKLNNTVLEEAKRKNEELGLIITQGNVEASKAYKLAMNDVGDVLLAVKKVIGDAVMPIFTELGVYFASTGPYVIEIFKGAMMGLTLVFRVIQGAVRILAATVFESFNTIMDAAGLLGETIVKFIKGDYQGAYEAGTALGKRYKQGVSAILGSFSDIAGETKDAVSRDMSRIYDPKVAAAGPKSGNKRMGDMSKGSGDKSRMSGWEAELAEQKLAFQEKNNVEGTFYQFSKAQELKFWADKKGIASNSAADEISIRRKTADLQLAINADAFTHEIASLQTQEAAFKQNMGAKLALLDQQAAIVKQRYGTESKEYEEVQKKIVEAKRQATEQIKQIDLQRNDSMRNASLAEIQLNEQQAQLNHDLHVISTAELIALQRQFEADRFAVAMQGLQEREQIALADPDRSVVELAKIHADIEELERQHQLRMGQIQGQATRESSKYITGMYDSLQSGFAGVVQKAMQGGLSLQGIFKATWQVVVQAVTSALSQIASEWLMKTLFAKLLGKTTAASEIASNAGVAGSAAVASTAAIPIIGPELAPAAGAAAFAEAMSFQGALASYDVGAWEVPSDRVAKIHAGETILPRTFAEDFRQNAGGGMGSGGDIHNWNVTALDSRSFENFLKSNGAALMAGFTHAVRRGNKG